MTFGRAIIISMIAHLGVLGYGYMQPPPADTVDLEFVFESEDRTVQVRRLNFRAAFQNDQTSQSPYEGVDVTAGLTPEGDEPAAVQSEPEPAPKPEPEPEPKPEPTPETDQTKTAATEPTPEKEDKEPVEKSEPDESPKERDSVVADKDTEAPVETEDTAPTPPNADSADNQKVAANAEESSASDQSSEKPPAPDRSSAGGGTSPVGSSEGTPDGEGDGAAGAPTGDGQGAGGGGGIDRDKLMREYVKAIFKLVAKNRIFPKVARRAGLEGTVTVIVKVDKSGRILEVGIDESSGHGTLDEAAKKTLQKIGRLPAPPKALTWDEKRFRIPIRYQLNQRG